MSTLVIGTSVALVMMFISIVGGVKRSGTEQELIPLSRRITIGMLGMLLIVFMGFYFGSLRPVGPLEYVHVGNKLSIDYPIEALQITSPLAGDRVECRILTMGVYPDHMEEDIWVVLKPSDNRYYPQSDFTNVSYKRNGKWQVITRFGGEIDERFELIVFTADKPTSEFFTNTIQQWKDSLSFPGLKWEEMPQDAKEVARIEVALKDQCRGVF